MVPTRSQLSHDGRGIAQYADVSDEETIPEGQPPAEKPKKSMGPLILVLVGVLLTVGGNAAVFIFLRPKAGPAEAPKAVVVENKVKSILHLDTFVVNLPDPEHHAYLRVGMDIGLNKEEKEKKEGEKPEAGAAGPIPAVRDTIIAVLSESKPDDLISAEGKKALKEQLVKKLQEKLPELGAQEVYFTEFLMQH